MQTKISKYLIQWQILTVCLMLLFFLSTPASSEETYVFERMLPTLQQAWYFYEPHGVAIDTCGNINVADTFNLVATETINVNGHAKVLGYAEDIFTQDITAATYIRYLSDKEVVGFQLNGSTDGMMLDGLPGM
jgi:hypothetical protein